MYLRNKNIVMSMTSCEISETCNCNEEQNNSHGFHCPGKRDATMKHQPIEDGRSIELFRISYVAMTTQLLLSMKQ
jgi:hypothetical protein